MFTIKIITTRIDGVKITTLITAERVKHEEHLSTPENRSRTDMDFPDIVMDLKPDFVVGGPVASNYTGDYEYSIMELSHTSMPSSKVEYAGPAINEALRLWVDKNITRKVVIGPQSTCYITVDGQTVDQFSCNFK